MHFFQDEDQYIAWTERGDEVLHIELQNLAVAYVIAPLSANTLAKFAGGLADNFITDVFRAWPFKKIDEKWQI